MTERPPQNRELALTLIQALYRVSRLGIYHSIDNKAFIAAASQLSATVRELLAIDPSAARILFLERSILVGTQYLKAPRAVYDSAMEVKRLLEGLGGNEISFERPITVNDVAVLVAAFDAGATSGASLPEAINIRTVDLSMFDGKLMGDNPDELAVRQYASAVVVLRHLFESLKDGEYVLLQHLKRISQSVLILAKDHTIQRLGIQSCRNLSYDEAGRAVSCAILVVAVLRQLTTDREILSLAAMSALLLDAGRPRVVGYGKPMPDGAVRALPRLSESGEERLAASTGVVLIALGRLHDKSLQRLVIAYEAQRCRIVKDPRAVHEDGRRITTVALIIAMVSEFIALLRFDQRAQTQRTPEEAVGAMRARSTTKTEQAVVDLLAGILKIFPMGTGVELATGWQGVVLGPSDGADPLAPRVRIVCDPAGRPVGPFDVDLGSSDGESYGWIFRALRTDIDDPLQPEKIKVVRESADFPAVDTANRLAVPPADSADDTFPNAPTEPGLMAEQRVQRPSDSTLEFLLQDVLKSWRPDAAAETETKSKHLLERFRSELHELPTRVLTHDRVKELLEQFLSEHRLMFDGSATAPPLEAVSSEQGPTTTQRLAQPKVDELLEGFMEGPSPSALVRHGGETPLRTAAISDALAAATNRGETEHEGEDVPTDLIPQLKVDELLDRYHDSSPQTADLDDTQEGGSEGEDESPDEE